MLMFKDYQTQVGEFFRTETTFRIDCCQIRNYELSGHFTWILSSFKYEKSSMHVHIVFAYYTEHLLKYKINPLLGLVY